MVQVFFDRHRSLSVPFGSGTGFIARSKVKSNFVAIRRVCPTGKRHAGGGFRADLL